MSTLSSSSTLVQIKAAYDDNASYEEDASVTKCQAFITACRLLLRQTPFQASMQGAGFVSIDVKTLYAQLNDAKRWLAVNSAAPRVRRYIFQNYTR